MWVALLLGFAVWIIVARSVILMILPFQIHVAFVLKKMSCVSDRFCISFAVWVSFMFFFCCCCVSFLEVPTCAVVLCPFTLMLTRFGEPLRDLAITRGGFHFSSTEKVKYFVTCPRSFWHLEAFADRVLAVAHRISVCCSVVQDGMIMISGMLLACCFCAQWL